MRKLFGGDIGFTIRKAAMAAACLAFGFTTLLGIGYLGKGELILNLNAGSEYDSNVFLNDTETGDLSTKAGASIAFKQEGNSLANLRARIGIESIRFADLFEQNSDNYDAEFDFSYPNNVDRNFYYSFGAGWDRRTRSRQEVGKRLESDRLNLRASLLANLSRKSAVRLSSIRETERFSDDAYFGANDFSADLDYLYRYSSKLKTIIGYRYHKLNYTNGNLSRQVGHSLRFGGEGQITAKVDGVFLVGLQYMDTSFESIKGESDLRFFYEMDLNWQASDKTKVGLSGSSDFLNSPTGEINNHRDLSISVDRMLSGRTKGWASFTLIEDSYKGSLERRDRAYRFDMNYSLYFFDSSSVGATLRYENRRSSLPQFDYEHFTFGIDFATMF